MLFGLSLKDIGAIVFLKMKTVEKHEAKLISGDQKYSWSLFLLLLLKET